MSSYFCVLIWLRGGKCSMTSDTRGFSFDSPLVFLFLSFIAGSDWQVLALCVRAGLPRQWSKKRIDGLRYFCGFCDSDIFKVTVSLNPLALHYKLKWIRVITMQNYLDLIETCRALQIERHSCPNKESRSAKPPWMRAHSKECELRRILNGKLSLECSFFRESACN